MPLSSAQCATEIIADMTSRDDVCEWALGSNWQQKKNSLHKRKKVWRRQWKRNVNYKTGKTCSGGRVIQRGFVITIDECEILAVVYEEEGEITQIDYYDFESFDGSRTCCYADINGVKPAFGVGITESAKKANSTPTTPAPGTFAQLHPVALAFKILQAALANPNISSDTQDDIRKEMANGPIDGRHYPKIVEKHTYDIGPRWLTPKLDTDFQSVEFDCENVEGEAGETYNGSETIGGIRTLPNGMTYWGICAGGDWEVPVFFIIYWDGTELRGYIPYSGNSYNKIANQAYGNDENSDDIDLKINSDTIDPVKVTKELMSFQQAV